MGAAQSDTCTVSMIPSVSKRRSSFSSKAYGTGRALQNLGIASGSRYNFASIPSAIPSSDRKKDSCLASTSSRERYFFECNEWTTPSNSIECASANPFPEGLDLILVHLVSIEQPVMPHTLLLHKVFQHNKSLSRIRTGAGSGQFQLLSEIPEFTVGCLTH